MTLLGGLFGKKSKSRQRDEPATPTHLPTPPDDDLSWSPTASYVTPDKHGPSVPNGKSYLHPDATSRDLRTANLNVHHHSTTDTMPSMATSKLRLPFGRKKSSRPLQPPDDQLADRVHEPLPPRPPYTERSSTGSDTEQHQHSSRSLRPPPSKSAIFAAYADPNSALSTRSLPNDSSSPQQHHHHPLSDHETLPPVPRQPKRPSLFAWTKSAASASSSSSNNHKTPQKANDDEPLSLSPADHQDSSSFSLKSFRHVGASPAAAAPSPTRSNPNPNANANASNVSLAAPIPRPRGDSVYNSDSSQRISVAAFREAQARRSMAGSPSPSGRSPSPLPPPPPSSHYPLNQNQNQNAYGSEVDRDRGRPRPSRSSPHIAQIRSGSPASSNFHQQQQQQQHRKSGMSFAMYASDTDESSEEEEEESEEDAGRYRPAGLRRGTFGNEASSPTVAVKDRMNKGRAKSEMGHGSSMVPSSFTRAQAPAVPSSSKSHLGHGYSRVGGAPPVPSPSFLGSPPPSSEYSGGNGNAGTRQRASNSTSALTPSAAAKRASVVAAANAANEADTVMQYKRASRHIRDSSVHSNPGEPISSSTAKKASTHLGHGGPSHHHHHPRRMGAGYDNDSDDDDVDSDVDSSVDSDSDNAPLAMLVAPRRPGSAMSSYSTGNVSARSGGGGYQKPLIDIKELTGGGPNRFGNAPTIARVSNGNGTGEGGGKSLAGFTGGKTLLAGLGEQSGSSNKLHAGTGSAGSSADSRSPSSPPPPPVVESPMSMSPSLQGVTSKTPPFKFVSPPGTPGKEYGRPPRSVTMPLVQQQQQQTQERESSPERIKRDALAERLSRAVKKKTLDGHTTTTTNTIADATRTTSPTPVSPVLGPSAPFLRARTASPGPRPTSNMSVGNSSVEMSSSGGVTVKKPSAATSSATLTSSTSTASPPLQQQQRTRPPLLQPPPPSQRIVSSRPSPPDQSLADLLGAGINLISLTGESDEERNHQHHGTNGNNSNRNSNSKNNGDLTSSDDSHSEDDDESDDNYGYESVGRRGLVHQAQQHQKKKEKREQPAGEDTTNGEEKSLDKITPIPIKQRAPLPSFSVTSRPQFPRRPDFDLVQQQQQQQYRGSAGSSVSGASSASGGSGGGGGGGRRESVGSVAAFASVNASASSVGSNGNGNGNGRKRSSTLIPASTSTSTSATSTSASASGNGQWNSSSHNNNNNNSPGANGNANANALRAVGATIAMQQQPQQPRQRSSTMLPMMPVPTHHAPSPTTAIPPSSSPNNSSSSIVVNSNINKPFAMRRDSPASSTGDSSSGRAPLTPRDGSDIGIKGPDGVVRDRKGGRVVDVDRYSGGASGLGISTKNKGKHMKRRSVSFEDDLNVVQVSGVGGSREFLARPGSRNANRERERDGVGGGKSSEQQLEERRRERRREEAKAAIELGNVINGRGPIVDDDDEDMPINQLNPRMSTMNPMMLSPMGMQQQQQPNPMGLAPPGNWGMNMGMNMNMNMPSNGMLSPAQFMVPPPNDPNFMAAHQQAMMIAKQAYQMAVAQQAMAAAADEWERSSNVGGYGGGSVYGGASPGPAQMMFGMMPGQMGMGGGMGMMGGGGNNWSTGSAIFPSSRSAYNMNMSSSRSEYGGGLGVPNGMQNWSSSRSSYGDFGPSTTNGGGGRGQRESAFGGHGNLPPSSSSSLGLGKSTPRMRTTSQPASPTPNRTAGQRRAPPPSSWKAGV